MKTKLILLKTPIIVSDEKIVKNDWFYHTIGGIKKCTNINEFNDIEFCGPLITNSYPPLSLDKYIKKIIAGQLPELPQIDYNGFEEQLGIVDIDKVAKYIYNESLNIEENIEAFKCGFDFCEERNRKKFSEEDVKVAIELAQNYSINTQYDIIRHTYSSEMIIEKLSQPKVFDIEVDMEYKDMTGNWYKLDEQSNLAVEKFNLQVRLKISNNKIKIIKIL